MLQTADWGHPVKVRVSFKDDGGHSETRSSAATASVAASGLEGLDVSHGDLRVPEQGVAARLTVRLKTAPTSSVTVTVTGQAGTALRVSPPSVTFTTHNWGIQRTISISAVHDSDNDNEQTTLTLTPTGAPEYQALGAEQVEVTVVDDDDPPGIRLSTPSLTVSEGRCRSYTVQLNTQPESDVTVNLWNHAQTTDQGNVGVTDSGSNELRELAFTSSSWNRPQTVTVCAPHDEDAGDGEGGKIIHSAWGDSLGYYLRHAGGCGHAGDGGRRRNGAADVLEAFAAGTVGRYRFD